jgi:hypothetical protein
MIEGNIGIYVSSAPFETLKKAVNTGWNFNASDFIIDAIEYKVVIIYSQF